MGKTSSEVFKLDQRFKPKKYENNSDDILPDSDNDNSSSFIENLINRIKEKKSVVCMGLDPRFEGEGTIPKYLIEEIEEPNDIIFEFNKVLIDNTCDLIPVIKPQIAFYEKHDALKALKDTITYAHKKDLLVIIDSKRNDISHTSEAYAHSTFRLYNADACTLNAYLGYDGIEPFLKYKDRGIFILVKTSNPSSNDFQNLFSVQLKDVPNSITEINIPGVVDINTEGNNETLEKRLYRKVELKRNYIRLAEFIKYWGTNLPKYYNFHNLGVVAGATYPQEVQAIRKIVTNSFILMPGFGAQGATVKDIKVGFNKNGLGGIVNSSRGIIYAYFKNEKYPPSKFGEAAREKITEMNQKIRTKINL